MGLQDTLEEKTVTVCYGSDFVNVNFINFSCTRKEVAQVSSTEKSILPKFILKIKLNKLTNKYSF